MSAIREQFSKGYELPIDWESFYAYFEERYHDPENDYKHQLSRVTYHTPGCDDNVTIMELLEEYRNRLSKPAYDMV